MEMSLPVLVTWLSADRPPPGGLVCGRWVKVDGVEFRARSGAHTGSYWFLCFACLFLIEAT